MENSSFSNSGSGFRFLKWILSMLVVVIVAAHGSVDALAQSDNPAGTWKWTFTRQNGETSTASAKLKRDGEKLTGVYIGNDGMESTIEQGSFKGGEISFQVKRERNGETYTVSYRGKLSGDTISGKSEFAWNDQKRSRDWEAKREKDEVLATGTWKWIYNRDGADFEITLRLKQEGDKVTGVSVWQSGEEATIREGRVKDGEMTLQVTRDYEGQTLKSEYKGKLTDQAYKGTLSSDVNGETYTYPFEAKRVKE